MFESQETTGTTKTVALLAVAFVFSPALLFVSRPVGYGSAIFAVACSSACAAWAWVNWKRSSRLSLPSIPSSRTAAK